ncbi:aspartate 1-decarboxylase [bacterium]|nr:aspartate 1-decarboxylase [bacterium]
MLRSYLISKIHRATITETDLNYVGSITIDTQLIEATGMQLNEEVWIYNINNGNRFSTYIIPGEYGSGVIGVNGAAAHKVNKNDKVIIVNYGLLDENEAKNHQPTVVIVDDDNKIIEKR